MSESSLIFLVAEKDMALRAALAETLRGMGFTRVLAAATGAQAWSLLNAQAPSFILSGLNLSDITGLSLLKMVRAHRQFARTPFILVSEILTRTQAMEAATAGVNDLMCRPLNPTRLKERIDLLLAQTFDAQQMQVQRLYQEGLALMNQKAWERALQAFSALAGAAESAQAHYHLGRILLAMGRPRQAAVSLARAVEVDPFFRRAFQRLGETLLGLGLDQQAEPHLKRAVEIYLAQLQDPESPASVFKEPLQPGSDYFSVFDSLGVIYRRQGRYREALDLYQQAAQINPKDGNVHHHIGRVHYEIGHYAQAAKELRKALELSPSSGGEASKLLKVVEARLASAR